MQDQLNGIGLRACLVRLTHVHLCTLAIMCVTGQMRGSGGLLARPGKASVGRDAVLKGGLLRSRG